MENNPRRSPEGATNAANYSFPVERDEFLFVTSPFGMRKDPMDDSKQQMHKGVDIRCKGDAVLATENGGKVVAVNHNKNTPGGKSLTVEYARADGSKVQCSYMHLSEVSVNPVIRCKPDKSLASRAIQAHARQANTCISV